MLQWNDILGHTQTLDVLTRAITSDRVHHAYLFVGPDGVGKHAVALAFAAAINCVERPEGEWRPACGTCVSCRKFIPNQHPDLHRVEPDGTRIKIGQIRAISKAAITRPYEARFQIVIINEAHRMTAEASNALLKTLEEPPATMRIFLVSDQPHLLLDTIRSRCQLLRFGPLPKAEVTTLIQNALNDEERREIPPELHPVAAGFGEGSVGRALAVLRAGILEERTELLERLARLDAKHPAMMLDWARALAKERDILGQRLETLRMLYRDIMMCQVSSQDARIVNTDLIDTIRPFARRMNAPAVLARLDVIAHVEYLLERNVNPQLATEHLLLNLAETHTMEGSR